MVVYSAYGSTANFRFQGSIAKINISKERQDYGDRSGPRILEIDSVIQKLSRFPQVQSEREWTLVASKLLLKSAKETKIYLSSVRAHSSLDGLECYTVITNLVPELRH